MFRQTPDDYQAEIETLKEQYEQKAAMVEDQAKKIAELEESVKCLKTYAASVYNDYLIVYDILKDIIESLNSSKHILPELFSPDAGKDS